MKKKIQKQQMETILLIKMQNTAEHTPAHILFMKKLLKNTNQRMAKIKPI